MLTDLRQAFRALRKSPGFAALVMVVLAIGIGATTAIFSVVNGVLLRPLPFSNAHRLVAVETTVRDELSDTSYPDFLDWRAQTATLDRLAAYTTAAVTLTGTGPARSVTSAVVTSDLLSMLGVRPRQGRVFTPEDEVPGAARAVVISESMWAQYFSHDPNIVGRGVTIDSEPFTIVGVMPASFEFPIDAEDPPQVWMPIAASRFAALWATQRNASFLKVIGTLREGASLSVARSELAAIEARLAAVAGRNRQRSALVRRFQDALVGDYRLGLTVLLSAVAAVLLIACANIANLLLARGSTRRREIALRSALGASRARIARQLVAESVMLALGGGAAGVALALWSADLLVRLSPLQIPRLHTVHVDRAALLFTALASMLAGVLSGVVPAFHLSRSAPGDALKEGERGGTAEGARTRQSLVVAEMAISLILLASAGLLVRSLVSLQRVSPGFVADRAVAMQILLPQARYSGAKEIVGFYRRLHHEVRSIPGVSSAAIATTLPMSGSDIGMSFKVEGDGSDPKTRTSAAFFGVSPEYFSTMGIPVRKGRIFSERDDEGAPNVLVVNETMVVKYWPGQDPIGKRVTLSYNNTGPREVVGVVGDVKQGTLADRSAPQLYTPFVQVPWPFLTAVARTRTAPDNAAGSLRSALTRVDPLQGAGEIKTLDEYVARSIATPRFTALLVSTFAGMALLLAGFGLFSVMAYSVARRRREIGIRMALGAQRSDVRGLIISEAIRMSAIGVAIGVTGAFAATRLLDSLLFGVTPTDPATYAGVAVMLVAVALLAAYVPALRATHVDPMTALRTE